jgi:hypothetical protein
MRHSSTSEMMLQTIGTTVRMSDLAMFAVQRTLRRHGLRKMRWCLKSLEPGRARVLPVGLSRRLSALFLARQAGRLKQCHVQGSPRWARQP